MPTLQPLLARVEHLSLAPEVEHPQRLAGALRVPLRHRMPSTAMWTVEEIADLERLPHAASICNPQDNPGQRLNWGYWSTLEFAFQLLTTADETCNLRRQRGDLVLQFRFSPGRHLGGSRRDGTACWSHARCVFSPPMSPEDWRHFRILATTDRDDEAALACCVPGCSSDTATNPPRPICSTGLCIYFPKV